MSFLHVSFCPTALPYRLTARRLCHSDSIVNPSFTHQPSPVSTSHKPSRYLPSLFCVIRFGIRHFSPFSCASRYSRYHQVKPNYINEGASLRRT
jgi:hypothetical protein